MNLLQALDDDQLFKPLFPGSTWAPWRTFLKSLFGLPLSDDQLAIAVLTAERLEVLLTEATESRAGYLESVGQLGWLLRHSGVPSTDGRPRQLVAGADMPPASWPEARTAGIQPMETAVTALMADPDAVI